MKRVLLLILVAIIVLPALQSCKKGENDPAISFKSRDARIKSKWKLTKIEYTEADQSGNYSVNKSITYDGLNYSNITAITGNPTDSLMVKGSYFMTIDKKGAMSWEESYTVGDTIVYHSGTGSWFWVDNYKNKSAVSIAAGSLFIEGGTWKIDRLATKELWLRKSGNSNSDNYTSSYEGTWYFEKE